MKHLNFLSKSSSRSCGLSSVTLASTVGSQEEFDVSGGNSRGAFTPADVCQTSSVRLNRFTVHRWGTMLKLLSVLVLILTFGVGNVWGANVTWEQVAWGDITTSDVIIVTVTTSNGTYLLEHSQGDSYTPKLGNTGTLGNNNTTCTFSENDDVKWKKDASNRLCKASDGTKWLYTGTSNNAMRVGTSTSGNIWSLDGDYIKSNTSSARYLSVYSTTDFRSYTSKQSGQVTRFYKASSCSNKVTITKGTPETGGSFNLDKTGEQNCCDALIVTVSNITAPNNKRFKAITQSGISAGSVTINNNTKTVTYAANTSGSSTINVEYEDIPTHTVTWSVNGATTTQDYQEGADIEFSEDVDGCEGGVFMGWAANPIDGTTDVAPTYVKSATMGGNDITYYAVFADETGDPTTTYDLISSINDLVAGEQYVIGHLTSDGDYYYMPNAATSSNPTLTSMTITGTQISSNVTNAMLWTLRESGVSGYGYKWESVASSSNYLATIASTGDKIRIGASSSYDKNCWDITTDNTYNWKFKSNGTYTSGNSTKTGKYAVIYAVSAWRVYSANGTNALSGAEFVIFKKNTSVSYGNYRTSCCTKLGAINGSFFWTTHFYPVWPEKHRLKGYYTNLGITSG